MSNLTFADAMNIAKANAQAPRQPQEGTPSGNSSQLDAWHAAISNQPPPAGSQPTQRAANEWLNAMNASAAAVVDEEAERARAACEIAAEREQQDREWAEYQAKYPAPDPVRAAALARAQAEKEDEEREAAYRADAERADAEMNAMWARREAQQGVAS